MLLECEDPWDHDADYEAGLALEDMGLLEEDANLTVAGYASTESEDLWDAYADDDTEPEALAGYTGDRPPPAFSDARSAHGRGSGSGSGDGAKGKAAKGAKTGTAKGKSSKGKGAKGKGKPTSKGGKRGHLGGM